MAVFQQSKRYHEDVLDLEEGLLSGSFDRLAILCDVAFDSSFLFDILARHNSLVKISLQHTHLTLDYHSTR